VVVTLGEADRNLASGFEVISTDMDLPVNAWFKLVGSAGTMIPNRVGCFMQYLANGFHQTNAPNLCDIKPS